MDYSEILERAQALAEEALATGTEWPAERMNLDKRIGKLIVGETWIAARRDTIKRLRYYGGFEYIDEEYQLALGDMVFYSRDDDRVEAALMNLEFNED